MKQKLLAFAEKMGLLAKVKSGTVTAEDWNTLAKAFHDEHGVDIMAAVEEAKQGPKLEKEQQDILAALFGEAINEPETTKPEGAAAPEVKAEKAAKTVAVVGADSTAQILAGITELQKKVATLEAAPEPSGPVGKIQPKTEGGMNVIPINSRVSSSTHLFGIEHDFFGLDKPWNKVAATREPQIGNDKRKQSDFKAAFNDYAASFAGRLRDVTLSGELVDLKMTAFDFTGFTGTGWGEAYIVRRQDALISYLRSLPTVRNIFPVIYNVQDKMEMTNSFMTDFSQAFQAGKVFKGKHSFEPMLAEVYDVMFKHLFEDMKKLERQYIGYLNREGSQPIKWAFIEWLMAETLRKLNNEWNERRVRGYRVTPITNEPGHHMFGSDGVIRKLWKYAEEFYIQPFTAYGLYTSTTMLTQIEAFVEDVNLVVPSLQGNWLYVNEKHIPWFLALYRAKYGLMLDFDGSRLEVKNYANFAGIKAVPNMGNSCMMWITLENNIELYEDQAGEMAAFYFERELESLIAASWWKEGAGAYMVGKKHATAVALAASKRKDQYIFMTYPVITLAKNATTADATKCDRFVTVLNDSETAPVFTDFTGATEGVVYRLECGHVTKATVTAKASLFSNIEVWTPTAVGDFLEVYWNATTSKFVEVRRKVTT